MARDKTRDLRKMNRRNFVKTLSGIGVSAGALRYMSKETLAQLTDDPKDRVPRLYGWKLKNPGEYNGRSRLENPPEREPEYYTIPRNKWVRVQTAHNAAEKLSRLLQEEYYSEGHSGIIDPAVTTITRGQKPQRAVVANYIREIGTNDRIISEPTITKEELEELVPDEMSGKAGQGKYSETVESIPVTVDVIEHKLTGGCNQYDCASGDYFDYKYEDSDGDHVVPSGCQMNVLNSGGDPCTTGVRAWDGEKLVMITAGHCTFDDDGSENPSDGEGRLMYQPELYDFAGTVDEVRFTYGGDDDWPFDAAVVRFTSSASAFPYARLADDSAPNSFSQSIGGTIAWDAIEDMENEDSLCKQGRSTGRCEGLVDSVSGDTSFSSRYFFVDASVEGGDSGGPVFDVRDDCDFYDVAGIVRGEGTLVVPMIEIENRLPVTGAA